MSRPVKAILRLERVNSLKKLAFNRHLTFKGTESYTQPDGMQKFLGI